MANRDEEINGILDALQQDVPYIEKPQELRVGAGGVCFLDRNRMCGSDCAAFTDASAPTGAERCTILVGINTGMVLLAELVRSGQQQSRSPAWSAPNVEPPNPLGQARR